MSDADQADDPGDAAGAGLRTLVPSRLMAEAAPGWGESAPLFLHSSFRTGSTWLWEKIRRAPTTFAYYEIFNEMLADLTLASVKATRFDAWESRHPAMPPYFLAFLPLVEPDGGVAGFERAMAFDGFIPQEGLDGPLAATERAYIDNLIGVARASGGLPVLSCTRSLGRARALRRSVGGQTVTIHRNLFHQWASYCSLAEAGNAYYVETVAKTVTASGHDPFLRGLASYFDLHEPTVPSQEVFQVFILLHLYIEAFAFDAADIVVDTTEVATDPEARQRAEHELSGLIRHPVDLSDVRHVCELPELKFAWSPTVRDSIEQFAKLIPRAGRSAESADFVERIKEQALVEWERFEFFNRGTRSVLSARIDDLETRLNAEVGVSNELRAAKGGLEAELADKARAVETQADALAQQAAAAGSEQRDLQARVHALSSERDDLVAQAAASAARLDSLEKTLALHTASAEREQLDLQARVEALSAERDDLATTAATSATRIGDLQARVEALSAERDDLAAAAATSATRIGDLQSRVEALSAERDDLAATAATAAARIGDLQSCVEAVSAERDELAATAATAAARIESLERELAEWAGLKTLWRRLARKPHGNAA